MRRRSLLVLVLTGCLLAACGGGDADVASDTKADQRADEAAGKDVDTEFSGKGGKDFCSYLKDIVERDSLSVSANASAEEQQKKAKETLEVYEALEDKAPSEIEADVKTILSAVRPYFEAAAAGRQPSPEELQALESRKAEFEAANARVTAYAEKVCKVKDDSTSTTTAGEGDGGGDGGTPTDEQAPAEEQPAPEA